MNNVLDKLKGGLIVSCQALANEPLHSSFIMGRMALAAKQGGAVGIRAQSQEDILEIEKPLNCRSSVLLKEIIPIVRFILRQRKRKSKNY